MQPNTIREIRFRMGTRQDIPALAGLFCDTVTRVNSRDYSPQQIAVWVGCATPARWDELFSGELRFIIADDGDNGALLGFSAVNAAGYLHSLFVHADFQHKGIGRGLLEQSEAYAWVQGTLRMHSEVSLTARPFFERQGYRVDQQQQVERGGVLMTNFVMSKPIGAEGMIE